MSSTSVALALSVFGFALAIIWGPPLLRVLRYFRIGKMIRVEGPESHVSKMGTPTMGGVMIILPVTLVTILLNAVSLIGRPLLGRSVLLPLLALLAFAVLGAVDDWEGIRGPRRGLGMRIRTKFLLQIVLAIAIAFALKYLLQVPEMFWPGVD
ncbi:phospho-N-acetylmuramoyl-pentapeptide-transferase, partial [bacterium]|nr:phospho-N-acetylmuramoyl-pentapeptide-transferase [bacterium]